MIKAGLDFGTTNSSLAVEVDGEIKLARFPFSGGSTESYRSLLYLERVREERRQKIKSWSGPQGIERYLSADEKGRLVQSLKSFLASKTLQTTEIFGRRFQLEELIGNILRDIRSQAEEQFGPAVRNIVVGRPVRFVGADASEDDDYALSRLRTALESAGFERVEFEFEPVAAAYHYEARLTHDELILIGDFGGGTSDFSLLQVGPSFRGGGKQRPSLGTEGLGLAGDAFDAKIVRHLVSPALGAGTYLESLGKTLPVPNWVYFKLERWHHLSFLRSPETLNMLRSVASQAREPEKLEALLYLVEHDLGYQLHRAVQRAKVRLSHAEKTIFRFSDGDVEIDKEVRRSDFEEWIADELESVREAVERLLLRTGVGVKDVDRVFLTGGSSFVPAVRRIFEELFEKEKLRAGDEFTSVAQGLALRGLQV